MERVREIEVKRGSEREKCLQKLIHMTCNKLYLSRIGKHQIIRTHHQPQQGPRRVRRCRCCKLMLKDNFHFITRCCCCCCHNDRCYLFPSLFCYPSLQLFFMPFFPWLFARRLILECCLSSKTWATYKKSHRPSLQLLPP